jgi:hypothetical protein
MPSNEDIRIPERPPHHVLLIHGLCRTRLSLRRVRRSLDRRGASVVNRLPVPYGVEIGIIAAQRDFDVPVENTHLPGEADHLVVPGGHTFIMNRPEVIEAVQTFLRLGRFGNDHL